MDARLAEKLERLPRAPGVYVLRDAVGGALYVGKASDLRSRVRSYFRPGRSDTRFFVGLLDRELGDIETIVTAGEREALILENSLIKSLRPRYNVRLRDDKDYLAIRLDERGPWPRLELVRRPQPDGARYFGPFGRAIGARQAVRVLSRLFRLRVCADGFMKRRTRPCLQHAIGRCDAPCVLPVDREAYQRSVRRVAALLEGRRDAVVEELEEEMAAASERLDFERAADIRDRIAAVETAAFGAPQRVVEVSDADRDVVGLYREGPAAEVAVLEVRGGRMVACRTHGFPDVAVPDGELLAGFLAQRYAEGAAAPDELLLPAAIPDPGMLAAFLGEARGRCVRVHRPRRGRLRELVDMAQANAEQRFREEGRDTENARTLAASLAETLHLPHAPRTVECADISHWAGHTRRGTTVGAVVRMTDGRLDRNRYRRFRLREAPGGDDYAALREMIRRRFERAAKGEERWSPPDLFVVDGGRGQLGVAAAVLDDLGITGVALAGIAKGRPVVGPDGPQPAPLDRIFVHGRTNPMKPRPGSSALHLIARLRDEAHRFANEYRENLDRNEKSSDSLNNIPGVGSATRRRLLDAFGSVARLRKAAEAEIAAVPRVGAARARTVMAALTRPSGSDKES